MKSVQTVKTSTALPPFSVNSGRWSSMGTPGSTASLLKAMMAKRGSPGGTWGTAFSINRHLQ